MTNLHFDDSLHRAHFKVFVDHRGNKLSLENWRKVIMETYVFIYSMRLMYLYIQFLLLENQNLDFHFDNIRFWNHSDDSHNFLKV